MADLPSSTAGISSHPETRNFALVSLPLGTLPKTSDLMLTAGPLSGKAVFRKQSSNDNLVLAIATKPVKLHELKVRSNSFHGADNVPMNGEQVAPTIS